MPAPAHPPDTDSTATLDSELGREQGYLDHARAELARMRASVERLDAAKASDADSAAALGEALARRLAALQDDPRSTLFFGRIDLRTDAERWYVGRRHVADADGEPVVVDWRAPVSTAFYRASHAEPMDVLLRRRFGVDRGVLTAIEDEHLSDPGEADAGSQILAAEIERPRTGPMRDIVSTIQPEQDVIVRSDVETTICVQGAPGTGKTAVGLHRAAWLLYSFRERLDRTGVLVVGPNAAFLDHIGAVLPALGEVRVGHASVETLLDHGRVRTVDPAKIAVLKGIRAWPRCCAGRSGATCGPRPRRASSRAAYAGGGCRRTTSRRSSTSSPPAACATRRPARCSRSGWRTRCCCRWSAPASRPTTGCRRRWRARRR
ncbi:hypothetical protein [Barrientosiimonas endolithica]|uniref:DNA helicase n=1 Tax=Barrientosiimonas endolithica TaxID=1535208 RepID=A0ABN6YR00_9MICO|nr:hypothetical protein [Barrientosiimonas endolithica]BDZ59411.1 hypothetical protein GCM10025872_30680 [Barrientosiimonas endolithica]